MASTNTKTFKELLYKKPETSQESQALAVPSARAALPVGAGRQTQPDGVTTVGSMLAEMASIQPDFNIQLLGALESLSIYNAEVSYAVDNLVQLGNTIGTFPENIKFDDSVSDSQIQEMTTRLKVSSKKWYKGGINSLVNDLLAQAAINGAVSAEVVPNLGLDATHKIVLVSPKTIHFKFDNDVEDYAPYQFVTGVTSTLGVKLNTTTYKYYPLRRVGEKPYGIPPFISALENLKISKDMGENLKSIVSNLGILGFLEVLVSGPAQQSGQSDADYYAATQDYLNKVVPEVEKGLGKGYVVGFEGNHKFNMQPTTTNVTGAKDLIEVNDVKLMAGLKQDPLMFGRNFSTTESLARVILAKMTTQVKNYQQAVVTILEDAMLLDLQLGGYAIENITIEAKPPMTGDANRDAETRKLLIENLNAEYNQGIISQEVRAQELGREKPDMAEPRMVAPTLGDSGAAPTAKEKEDTTKTAETKNSSNHYATALGVGAPLYEYDSECNCGSCAAGTSDLSFMLEDGEFFDFMRKYYQSTESNFDSAVQKTTKDIAMALAALGEGASEQMITDAILYNMFKTWGDNFSVPQRKIIDRFIKATYTFFKKDDSIFSSKDGIGKGTMNSFDLRAIDYFKKSDNLYLGKFITDPDLKRKISNYVKEQYLEGDYPINSPEAIASFRKEFSEVLEGQDWKLTRIISTTVNKLRNSAAVSYMHDAGVDTFEIVGVNDRLQCPYCKAMQGMRFSVAKARTQLDSAYNSDPEIIGLDSPFINSVYKKPEDLEGVTADQLQAQGIGIPSYHSGCRDQAIAVL